MNDTLTLKGHAYIIDKATGQILYEKDNLIVNSGKSLVPIIFMNTAADYLASISIGNGTAVANTSDTNLQSELLNKTFSSKTTLGNTFRCESTFLKTEANGSWKEAGIKSNLGILFNRVNIDYIKTNTNDIIFRFDIAIN